MRQSLGERVMSIKPFEAPPSAVRGPFLRASLISFAAAADTTTLSVVGASITGSTTATTTLNFPVSRSGDTSYDAYLSYHTVDGSAAAGTDYTAASGLLKIRPASTSATIRSRLPSRAARGSGQDVPDIADSASGVGPTLGLGSQTSV